MISKDEFTRGYQAFQKQERRDAMYKIATFLLVHFWGKPKDMADGMGVLLLTWNQAFYRYGHFDFDKLEATIQANLPTIQVYRDMNILDLKKSDEAAITSLFNEFLKALEISGGKLNGRKSPVATAKALHLLGPSFFPLWDDRIARAYDCYYNPNPAEMYISFSYKMQGIAKTMAPKVSGEEKTFLKLIDEYNYAKHTKAWI